MNELQKMYFQRGLLMAIVIGLMWVYEPQTAFLAEVRLIVIVLALYLAFVCALLTASTWQ